MSLDNLFKLANEPAVVNGKRNESGQLEITEYGIFSRKKLTNTTRIGIVIFNKHINSLGQKINFILTRSPYKNKIKKLSIRADKRVKDGLYLEYYINDKQKVK